MGLPFKFWIITSIAFINAVSFTIIIPTLYPYAKQLGREGLQTRRRRQHARWFERSWPTRLAELVEEAPGASATLAHLRAGLAAGTLDVDAATATLLDDLRARLSADPTPP